MRSTFKVLFQIKLINSGMLPQLSYFFSPIFLYLCIIPSHKRKDKWTKPC